MEIAVSHLLVFLLQIPQKPQNPLPWPDVEPRRARIGDLSKSTPSSPVSQFFLFLHFVQMAVFPKTHPMCLCSFCFFFPECLSSPTSLTQLESKTSFNPPQMALPSFFSMASTNHALRVHLLYLLLLLVLSLAPPSAFVSSELSKALLSSQVWPGSAFVLVG